MSDKVIDIDAMLASKSGSDQSSSQADTSTSDQSQQSQDNSQSDASDSSDQSQDADQSQQVQADNQDSGTDGSDSQGSDADDSATNNGDDQQNDNSDSGSQQSGAEPAELNLDEYEIEVDGKARTVNELLDERDALAKRVAEVEKDEFLMRFIAHRQAGGDPKEFLESQTVDWDKEDNVSVLKRQFFKEYSDIDLATRELMFEKELKSKYNIDPNASPEDVDTESRDYKIGQAILKRDAEKARASFKEEQKKFAIPEKQAAAQEPQKFDQEAYKKQIAEDESIAKFSSDKLLKLDVKNEEGNHYGYEVEDPSSIIEMMSDDRLFWKSFFGSDGKLDRAKQAKVYAFAANPEKFEQNLIAIGRALGTEKVLKEKRNTDGMNNKGSKTAVGGEEDFKKGFLKAAKQQKV